MVQNNIQLSLNQMLAGLGPGLFSSIRAPFGIFDKECRIVWINKAMGYIHRCDPDASINKPCQEALRSCGDRCRRCPLKEAIATGRTQVMEDGMDFPEGRRWGELHAYPVRGQDKSISAVIVIVFETTEKNKALQRQKDYTDLLEQKLDSRRSGAEKIITDAVTPKLSRRESDVLRLITEGYTNTQIAELLDISGNTVKTHVNNVFNKLGVNDRTQAAVIATRSRML